MYKIVFKYDSTTVFMKYVFTRIRTGTGSATYYEYSYISYIVTRIVQYYTLVD